MTDRIIASLEKLSDFPFSGAYPPDDDMKKNGFRMAISGIYISVYRMKGDIIYIYHIFNGSRDYVSLFANLIHEKEKD